MQAERDALRKALNRLGRVPPEALDTSRERVRGNLKAARRSLVQSPLPDAAPADLTALRRPLYFAWAAASVCVLVVAAIVTQWKPKAPPASTQAPLSTSKQTSDAQPLAQPLAQTVTVDSSRSTTPPKPSKRQAPNPARPAATRGTAPPPAPRQVRFTLLPPGEGRVILDRACDSCHRAASVGAYHFATRAEYSTVVARMISMGAPVSEQEASVLVDYLFENLATKPGQAILERACTVCHSLNGLEQYSYDSEGPYRELVSTMVSYGAVLTEAEEATLIQYLYSTYGKR